MTKPVGGEAVLLQASATAGAEPRRGAEAASAPADGFALMLAGLLAGPQAGAAMPAATPSPPAEPVPAPVAPRRSSALPWDALAAAAEETSRLAAAFQMPLPALPPGVEMVADGPMAAAAMPLSATPPSGLVQEAAASPLPEGAPQPQEGLAESELATAGKAALPPQPDPAAVLSAAPSTPQADWPMLPESSKAVAASLPAGAQAAVLPVLPQDTAEMAPAPAILPLAAAPGASASVPEAGAAIPVKAEPSSAPPPAEPKADPASLAAERLAAASSAPPLAQAPAAVEITAATVTAPARAPAELPLPPPRTTAVPPARPAAAAIPVDSAAPRMAAPALVATAIAPSPAASEMAPHPAEEAAPPDLEAGAGLDRVLPLTSTLPEISPDLQPLPLSSGQGAVAPAALSAPAPTVQTPMPAALPQHRMAAEAAPQLVLRMAQAARKEGVETISVDLRPPELGRVELQLTFRDGTVQVVMRAEQAETFEALRHERHNLVHQMEQAGLQLGGSGLDLQHGPLPQPKPEPEQALAGARRGTPETEEAEGRAEAAPAARPRASDSLIDIIT